ncbi:MAG: hypothetical protein ACAH88_14165, partial [Roseimicrobium sp.]
ELALDFAVAHEFAHILNGHLDFYLSHGSALAMGELDACLESVREAEEAALFRQAIEVDADLSATHVSLRSEWDRIVGINPRRGPEWEEIYDSPGTVSYLWSFAVATLCRVFGDMRPVDKTALSELYPRWRLRSAIIVQTTGAVQKPDGLIGDPSLGESAGRLPPSIMAAYADVEKAFSVVTGLPLAVDGFRESWSISAQARIDQIRTFWESKLKPQLAPFRIGVW